VAKWFLGILAAAVVVLGGCSAGGYYLIDVYPTEDGMRRVVRFLDRVPLSEERIALLPPSEQPEPQAHVPDVSVRRSPPDEMVARLNQAYGRADADGRWEATFASDLPAVFDGAGVFDRAWSPLGSEVVYTERFGGTDDLLEVEATRKRAVEVLGRLIRTWVMSEVARDPRSRRLGPSLARQIDKDLGILSLMATETARVGSHESDSLEMSTLMPRLQLYLYEHGYTERWSLGPDRGYLVPLLRPVLRREMGIPVDAPDPPCLAFLADDRTAFDSFDRYLRGTEEFRRVRRTQLARGNMDWIHAQDTEGVGISALLHVIADSLSVEVEIFKVPYVTVRVRCPVKPAATNGEYDERTGIVERQIPLLARSLPTQYVYVRWVEPDRERQERLFGRVLLDGQALVWFAANWSEADEAERAGWIAFARSLEPGAPLERLVNRIDELLHDETTAASLLGAMLRRVREAAEALLDPKEEPPKVLPN
jgi:hypothetical protein